MKQIYEILRTLSKKKEHHYNHFNKYYTKCLLYKGNDEALELYNLIIVKCLVQAKRHEPEDVNRFIVTIKREEYHSRRKFNDHINYLESLEIIKRIRYRRPEFIVNPDYNPFTTKQDLLSLNRILHYKTKQHDEAPAASE